MAITAKFQADFSSFVTAVEKAEAELKSFETGAERVQRQLNRMTDGFSGRRLIQEATLTAKAVDDIGGVSKLTESELRRVGATASEAVAKMKALGMEVPPGLQRLARATEGAAKATDGLAGKAQTLNGILGTLGIGLSVGAVVSFGKAVFADADALDKLNARTGISIQGLQRLQIAGDDAGNTIEQMAGAINQMQNRLASGDASAVGALQKLNINLEEFRALSPDRQFMAASDALRQIEDPAQRVAVAMDLFGRSGSEVLPTIARGLDDVRDKAVGMSDDTVRALAKAGDEIDAFWRLVKAKSAEGAVAVGRFLYQAIGPFTADKQMIEWQETLKEISEMAGRLPAPSAFRPPSTQFTLSEADRKAFDRDMAEQKRLQEQAAAAAKRAAEEYAAWAKTVAEVGEEAKGYGRIVRELNGDVVEAARYYADQGVSLQKVGRMYGLTDVQVEALTRQLQFERSVVDATSKSLGGWNRQMQVGLPTVRSLADALDELDAPPSLPTFGKIESSPELARIREEAERSDQALQGVSQAFALLAQVSGDAFSGMERSAGRFLSQMNTLQSVARSLGGNLSTTGAAWIAGPLAVIGFLGDRQAREDAENAAISAMSMDAVRRYTEEASRYMGQYGLSLLDAVNHSRTLEEAQARIAEIERQIADQRAIVNEAERRYGPGQEALEERAKQAKAILDYMTGAGREMKGGAGRVADFTAEQLSRAYYDWQKAMADAGDMAAKAWVAAQDAAKTGLSTSNAAIDELTKRRDGLLASIAGEAPEAVMGVVEAQTRGQIAALDDQIEKQRLDLERQAEEAARGIEQALRDVDVPPIKVKVEWDAPPLPTPGGVGAKVVPMAAGGFGTVTKPTLFLAGEAGPEQFAFSGANRRFADGGDPGLSDKLDALSGYLTGRFKHDLARAVRDQRQLIVGAR